MNDHDDDASFDATLRQHLWGDAEPDDAGFSLRVMAALPPRVSARQRYWASWVRRARWLASSGAACGAAVLLGGGSGPVDAPHALAAVALVGLLAFWTVPSCWSRG